MTGRIIIDMFTTLDGVAQAPGGPEEDPSDGFPFGGWQAPLPSEAVGRSVDEGMKTLDALLLGRRTYDIFAGYWPNHTSGPEGFIGQLFDRVPKYVASRDADIRLDWQGSTRVGADLASEIAALREKHNDVHVIGSIDFVQTLLTEKLYDELQLWVYPIVLGQGKKVFPEGAAPANLRLLHAEAGDGGALLLRYAPLPGEVQTGVMGD
ncbi:dihydrofolate reductase family protein [Microbacterium sp. H1-D42]|uniref:dihydrofolate reductase family protein n=1 Tax=Microbacterium sp. H1-D42 TaxID=2925844 RepID=UPI001F535269|nr:dihydrofolate reductase family protein [Microbacterium sp. H1-D42]UNK71122.1 dihydrofolate reductase family protein [Microbacterium sp. H1-D42]